MSTAEHSCGTMSQASPCCGADVPTAVCVAVVMGKLGRVAIGSRIDPGSEDLKLLCHARVRRCSAVSMFRAL